MPTQVREHESPAFFAVGYTPDYNEMFAVQRASRRYHFTSGQRSSLWLLFLPYAALIAGTVYFDTAISAALRPYVGRTVAHWVPLGLFVVSLAIYVWLLYSRIMPRTSARWLEARKPLLPTDFRADDSGLHWQSSEYRSWIKWTAIERVFVTPGAVCFLYGGASLYLPRRLFKDEAQIKIFVERVLASLSPAARELSVSDAAVRSLLRA